MHPINGRRRGENDLFAARTSHYLTEDQRAGDIVVVIAQRNFARFTNSLQTGEMDDCVDLILFKHAAHTVAVEQINLI